jgi:arylsulfatase
MELTHSNAIPPGELLARGPQIVEATAGGPLRMVKPFTPAVRANIDYELVDKSIDFIRQQKTAGKPFRFPWDTCQTCLRGSSGRSRGLATMVTS